MKLNNHVVLLTIITFLIATKQASCFRFNKLFPEHEKPTINPTLVPLHPLPPSPSPLAAPAVAPSEAIASLLDDHEKGHEHVIPQEVVQACEVTDFPTECSASMAHFLHGKVDALSIFQAEGKALEYTLEEAKEQIVKLSSVNNVDKQAISTCEEMYWNARDELTKAKELITEGRDKYGAMIRLSAALTYVGTCDDGLRDCEHAEDYTQLIKTNKMMFKLASNCFALGNSALYNVDVLLLD